MKIQKTLEVKDKLTITGFRLENQAERLLLFAEFSGTGVGLLYLLDPENRMIGFLNLGFGNFLPEIYISDTICTRNAKPVCLVKGDYTLVLASVSEEEAQTAVLSFSITTDQEKSYEDCYVQNNSELEPYDFESIHRNEARFYKGDLHGHTILSDGWNSMKEAGAILEKQQLDFMAFTEHNALSFFRPDIPCLFVPSFELTLPLGHVNIHGIKGMDKLVQNLAKQLTKEADLTLLCDLAIDTWKEKANISLNHMFMVPWEFNYDSFDMKRLNTIEVICDPTYPQADHANEKAVDFLDFLWTEGLQIYGVGGSDCHNKITEPYQGAKSPSVYGDPATYVYCDGLSVDHLIHGIRNGNSYVTRGIELEIAYEADKKAYLPGSAIASTVREISCRIGIKGNEGMLIGKFLYNKDVLKEMRLSGEDQSASITIEVIEDYGWLRFGLYDEQDNVISYVNPVSFGQKECSQSTYSELLSKFMADRKQTNT